MIEKLVSKRSWIAINAGILLCAVSGPVAVLAQTQSSGTQSLAVKSATRAQAPAAAAPNACPASIPSMIPDPVLSPPVNSTTSFFNDAEAAQTDSHLPAGFVPPGSGATTGTIASPVPAAAFGIGFFDETELHESTQSSFPHATSGNPLINSAVWPNGPGTVATDTGTLTHTAAGAAAFGSPTAPYGLGQPYAAILTPDLKTTLIAKIPTQVLFQGYNPNPTGGHVNYTGVMSNCGNGPLYAILGFDVTKYNLDPTKVYAAYILMADTDSSGPLANHVWFFKFAPPNPPTFTVTKDVQDGAGNSINGQTVPKGTQLNYVVTVTNTSNTTAGDPGVITDKLSKLNTSLFTVDTQPHQTSPAGGTITGSGQGPWTWDPGTLAAGQSAVLKMQVTINAQGGELDNSACLSNIVDCSPPLCPAAALCNPPCPTNAALPAGMANVCNFTSPQFSIAKDVQDANGTSINGQTVPKGTLLHYVVTVTNTGTGPGSPGVITDKLSKLDPSLFVVTTEPSSAAGFITNNGAGSQGPWTWAPGTIPAKGTVTLTMVVQVNAQGGELDNTACLPNIVDCSPPKCPVAAICSPPCPTNGALPAGMANVCNPTAPVFSIAKDVLDANGKSINGVTVPKGTQLHYVVTVTNNGTAAGDPGVITDKLTKLDPSLFVVDAQPTGPGTITGNAPGSQGPWTWDPGSIAAGGNAQLSMLVTVNALGGELDNSACLPGAATCPIPCPAGAGQCPNPCPDLQNTPLAANACNPTPPPFSITKGVFDANGKSINGQTVPKGTQLHYVVTATNNGTVAGDPGVITDKLSKIDPTLFTVDVQPSGPGTITGNTAGSQGPWTWDPGNIAAGGNAQLTMTVTVNSQGGEIDNSACLPGAADCPPACPTTASCPGPCTSVQETPDAATVCNFTPPLVTLDKCIVTTTACVNSTTQAVGDTVTYKVTVTNPASAQAAVKNVLVDDVVTTPDNLPFIVNDGVNLNSSNAVTTNSFQGSPVVSVTKVATNHYQWTFASLDPGQSGVVTFTITIGTPAPPAAGTTETLHVDNTASEPTFDPPPVTVHSNVPLAGGVQPCTTTTCPPPATPPATPPTGAQLNLRVASGLFVGGLFLILFGLVSRPQRRRTA